MKKEKGFVALKIKTPGQVLSFYLNLASDKVAYTGGVSRHMGYVVKLLENGNVYFSGFEFSKKK